MLSTHMQTGTVTHLAQGSHAGRRVLRNTATLETEKVPSPTAGGVPLHTFPLPQKVGLVGLETTPRPARDWVRDRFMQSGYVDTREGLAWLRADCDVVPESAKKIEPSVGGVDGAGSDSAPMTLHEFGMALGEFDSEEDTLP